MDPAEIAPVLALKEKMPRTVGDLRQLLGFLSYYRSFVPSFACKAKPLYDLLAPPKSKPHDSEPLPEQQKKMRKMKKGHLPSQTRIQWTAEHQAVLNQLIQALISCPYWGTLTLTSLLHSNVMLRSMGWGRYYINGKTER